MDDDKKKKEILGHLIEGKPSPSKDLTLFTTDHDTPRVEKAKQNIEDVVKIGTEAVLELSEIARASEHPRAYEVLANMLKTLVDANKTLIDTENETHRNKKDQQSNSTSATPVHQHIHVGSTKDLLDIIAQKKKDG